MPFRHRLAARLGGAFVLLLAARALPAQTAPFTLTAAEARGDFDILRRALEEAHDGLYRFAPKPEMDRRLDAFRARITGPMERLEFIALLSEMLAAARDGHLRLEYDKATTAALAQARLFPFRVALEGPRLVIVTNETPADTAIRPGMEILGISGRPAGEVIGRTLPRLPGDGFIETGKRARLARSFGQLYWLFVAQDSAFDVEARDRSGRVIRATVTGVPERERAGTGNPVNAAVRAGLAAFEPPKENVHLAFPREDVGYLRIRGFGGEAFPQSLDSVFRVLRDRGTKALVLDLRGNGGGVDQFGAMLVAHLTDRPFRYFDRIHLTTIRPSFATWKASTFTDLEAGTVPDPAGGFLVTPKLHGGVGEQRPAAVPFTGRLVVLADGGTFSTAADVCAQLRSLGRAGFVGEETGGGYEGNTSGLNALITLPASGLGLKIPMYGYWNAVAPPPAKGRGVIPEHTVATTVADLLRRADPQLERALELAARP